MEQSWSPFDKTVGLGLLHISRVRLWLQTTKYSSRLSRSSRVAHGHPTSAL